MPPEICNYQDTDYKKFWSETDRRYEDWTERLTLRKFLPKKSRHILELGAGFGRLLPEYFSRTQEVVLYDYSQELLDQAQEQPRPADLKVSFIQGDVYRLPFADNSIETVVMVRVAHHLEDPSLVFKEVFRVLEPGGTFIFEYANKRHGLEILRFFSRVVSDTFVHKGRRCQTPESPFNRQKVQRGESVYFNFHPAEIEEKVRAAGFRITAERSVSNFRAGIFKKIIPYKILAFFDRLFSWPLTGLRFGPSIFVKAVKNYAEKN